MLRIKWERLKREWTQTQLGRLTQMAGTDISKIERGLLHPYPGQRERLAQVLGIDPAELLIPACTSGDVMSPGCALMKGRLQEVPCAAE
jgi:transcriptional regulator with XRE-family HTH domain